MIYSLFAETIPELIGEPPTGTPQTSGKTCAVVMSKLFKLNHAELAGELATMQVAAVREQGMRGLALLRFPDRPPHIIMVHRERGAWKIDETVPIETS